MITKVGENDRFGYDDAGRAAAAELASGVYVFSYDFCARLKETENAGFVDLFRLYTNELAIIVLYSPATKTAEVWYGSWAMADGAYHIINPTYTGLLDLPIRLLMFSPLYHPASVFPFAKDTWTLLLLRLGQLIHTYLPVKNSPISCRLRRLSIQIALSTGLSLVVAKRPRSRIWNIASKGF